MYFNPDNHTWSTVPGNESLRYKGEVDAVTGLPRGMGILAYDDCHFYIGELQQGRRHGRGFMFRKEVTSEVKPVWHRGTYEEVMATAEFDSCGRPIHYENVGKWVNEEVKTAHWYKEQDGYWKDDAYMSDADVSALYRHPWTKRELGYMNTNLYDGKKGSPYGPFYHALSDMLKKNGSFGDYHLVTLYDEDHLLLVTHQERVCKIGVGETFVWNDTWGDPGHEGGTIYEEMLREPEQQ